MPNDFEAPEVDIKEEKILFSWQAAERSFKKRNRDFWITAIAILVLVSIILFFVKESFLILALMSMLFLYYVLSTVPPGVVNNKITNRGIYFGELFYPWMDLARFWFAPTLDNKAVYFETQLRFPREVSLIIDPKDSEEIKKQLLKYLPLVASTPRFIDKAAAWMTSKLPLEDRIPTTTNKK